MDIHENAGCFLQNLPDHVSINGSGVFADGGSICLYSEVSPTLEISICLPPVAKVLYPDRKPKLFMQLVDPVGKKSSRYAIAVRSQLEFQVIGLLKTCEFDFRETRRDIRDREFYNYPAHDYSNEVNDLNLSLRRMRDKIVEFVESNRYVELNNK